VLVKISQTEDAEMKFRKSANDYFHEAGLLLQKGNLQEASKRLKKGLNLDPTFKAGWMNLGVALKDLGEFNDAEQSLKNAIELDNNYGDAWFNLGSMYLRQMNRPQDAFECLQEAMRCNPYDEDAVCFAAEALQLLGRSGEAIALLDSAVAEHPNFMGAKRMRDGMGDAFRSWLEDISN
jgi:tetratricopeptide (TPR) repeat protein